jgi:hypothetical protein
MAPWRGTGAVLALEPDDFFLILGAAIQSYKKQRYPPGTSRSIRIPGPTVIVTS